VFVHYRTQGIILKKNNLGEVDQLLTIYTKDFGKLEILAKAVRKISSKLRAGVDLFYLSEIEFIQGKTHKTLTDAILIEKFKNLRNNLTKIKVAYKIAQTADDLIKAPEPDPKIWDLLNEVFRKLNDYTLKPVRYPFIYYYFFWNLVSLLGYQPQIKRCAIQGRETDCDVVKIIKVIFRNDWKTLSRLKVEYRHLELLKKVSKWYRARINL
jgi:DNA repair protein RecO (recombination protein O)